MIGKRIPFWRKVVCPFWQHLQVGVPFWVPFQGVSLHHPLGFSWHPDLKVQVQTQFGVWSNEWDLYTWCRKRIGHCWVAIFFDVNLWWCINFRHKHLRLKLCKAKSTGNFSKMNSIPSLALPIVTLTTLQETNIAMGNPPFWWYLPGKMGIFMGYVVSFREGKGKPKEPPGNLVKKGRSNSWWVHLLYGSPPFHGKSQKNPSIQIWETKLNPRYTPFLSRWNNPLILTIDPSTSWDIQGRVCILILWRVAFTNILRCCFIYAWKKYI